MKHLLAIPFAAIVTWLVAWAAGKWLFQKLRVKLSRSEELFLCFVSGSAILSLVVFLLTAARLAYTGVFVAAGALIVLAAWRSGALRPAADRLPPLPRMWSAVFWLIYAAYGWFYLAHAMRPEASADGLVYHVAFPAQYLREHGFPAEPRNMLMHLSQGLEMLYLFAFALGRHSAPAMVHLLFTLLTPLGLLDYGRRMGRPAAGVVAGLLFFLSPIVGRDGTTPYLDVGVAAILFAAFYVLEIWREEGANGAPVIAGLLGGFAYAVKYTAGLASLYALGYVVYHLWRQNKPILRLATGVCLAAGVMILPWVAKNYLLTGNPISPFGNELFPNPVVYVSSERSYIHQMSNISSVKPAEIPLEVTKIGRAHV